MKENFPIFAQGINYVYAVGHIKRAILQDATFSVRNGEIVMLSGPSGSGKTTLLTLIGALRQVQTGTLKVLGQNLATASPDQKRFFRQKIGFIFQQHNLLACITAQQNVEMTLEMLGSQSKKQRENRAKEILEKFGMGAYRDAYPHEMSVGQKQRVSIARAVVHSPDLILADEPTASLDKDSGIEVMELLKGLAKEKNKTVFIVTHDNRIFQYADRIISIDDGKLKE